MESFPAIVLIIPDKLCIKIDNNLVIMPATYYQTSCRDNQITFSHEVTTR
jgi:hypothetical protein